MNGVVSLLAVKEGERVVGTAQMAGTEMMRVADYEQAGSTRGCRRKRYCKSKCGRFGRCGSGCLQQP